MSVLGGVLRRHYFVVKALSLKLHEEFRYSVVRDESFGKVSLLHRWSETHSEILDLSYIEKQEVSAWSSCPLMTLNHELVVVEGR